MHLSQSQARVHAAAKSQARHENSFAFHTSWLHNIRGLLVLLISALLCVCVCSQRKLAISSELIYRIMHVWKTLSALVCSFAYVHNGSGTGKHMCMCIGLCVCMLANAVGSAASFAINRLTN